LLVGPGGEIVFGDRDSATGPALQRHGHGQGLDLDPPVALADLDDPPLLEAETHP
jgi:hypothetical protein